MLGGRWLSAFWASVPLGKMDSQCPPSPVQHWAQWDEVRGHGQDGLLSSEKPKDWVLTEGLSLLSELMQAPCPHADPL